MFIPDPRLAPLRDGLAGQVLRGSGEVSYHLRERIGEGGQGWVFKANWDEPGGLVVIVKVLRPDAVHGEALRRFQREAEVLRLLTQQSRPNPHIVRFFDHAVAHVISPMGGERIMLPFTVLEYVNGPTLEHVLKSMRGHGLPVERVRRLLRQIVLALDMVHAQKVVHRDLKPSNILLANEAGTEIAKVTDFGLVKLVDVNLQRTTTLAGASLGYAPPEQYEQGNQRVTPRTDVFSLAAITYEMLSGRLAFPYKDGENPLLIVTRILNGPRPALGRHPEGLPPELAAKPELVEALDAQLGRALSPDPADRQESVQEYWAQIEPILRAAHEPRAPTPYPHQIPFASPDASLPLPGGVERRPISGLPGGAGAAGAGASSSPSGPSSPPQGTGAAGAGGAGSASPPRTSQVPPSNALGTRVSGAPLSRMRAPSSAAANPAAWSWQVSTRSISPGTIRGAVFGPGGDYAIGVGPSGLARLERGAWVAMTVPPSIDLRAVRGVRWLKNGDLLMFGARALAVRMSASGASETWTVPDRDITFLGACSEESGVTTLVGERPARVAPVRPNAVSTIGALAQFTNERLTLVSDAPSCTRLRAACRLRGGTFVACGDWGTLVRLELGVADHVGSVCGGHLSAIAELDDGGAVTVGVGGHALYVTPRLEAQLEAVQTTRDLLSLTVGEDGTAWAGAAQARLLRRTNGSWVRMSGEVGITPGVVAIWAGARVVRAVCDDGAVLEGRLA